ncbi:hypothetical protein BDV93DRAFT_609435 [Ceratobasidium sp. AG-I]|nr:hypothetical protein BDV93DRAFT_609435 [Ceratobasidium sp. AG-I]
MTRQGKRDYRGLILKDFLASTGFIVQASPSSITEIEVAIQTLAHPRQVSCSTFETILSMHRHPYCIHLPLLLSKPGVITSCIQLLREYTERDRLLDYGYGYLCLQVIALSIEVGILSQTGKLEAFIADVSNLPSQDSIARTLVTYLDPLTDTALKGREPIDMFFLLGLKVRSSDAKFVALHQIGGVTVVEAEFLVEILWDSRENFFEAAQWAVGYVPGWSRLILVIWQSFVQQYRKTPARPDEKHWVSLTDIASRYSLFSAEREGVVMPSILGNCKATTRYFTQVQGRSPTYADIADSEAIATIFTMSRLKSTPLPNIIFATMLFDYACINLHPSIFHTRIPEIFTGVLERAWVQLEKVAQLNDREIGNLSTFFERISQTILRVLSGRKWYSASVLAALTEEIFVDYLGRVALLPIFSPDRFLTGELQTNWKNFQGHIRALCEILSKDRISKGFEPGPMAFRSWNKTLTCLRTQVLLLDSVEHLVMYAVGFEIVWIELGKTLGIRPSSDQGCVNPQCAAPNAPVYWKCENCQAVLYCDHLCQGTHWLYAPDPHKAQCVGQRAGKSAPSGE